MGSSSGSGGTSTSTSVQQPGGIQVAPQWSDYFSAAGLQALNGLGQFPLQPFSNPVTLQVPGLNDLQQGALGIIGNQTQNGIPTPYGEQALANAMPYASQVAQTQIGLQPNEQQALNYAAALPGIAGQQVGFDPIFGQQYANSQQLQQVMGNAVGLQNPELAALGMYGAMPGTVGFGTNPYEVLGGSALANFAGGGIGNSPAMAAAEEQIRSQVTPKVLNQMAMAGLGRSGAMGAELQKQMTGTLLPLYMQGLQQQQSAGSELANLGTTQQGQIMSALGQAAQGGQQIGASQANRLTDAYNRVLQMEPSLVNQAQTIGGTRQNLATDALQRLVQTSMQSTIPSFMQAGQNEAQRQQQTVQNILNSTAQQYGPMLQLGQSELGQNSQRINNALTGGALQRDVQGQMSQAQYADAMRRQGIAEQFAMSMLGQVPAFTAFPQVTQQSQSLPIQK